MLDPHLYQYRPGGQERATDQALWRRALPARWVAVVARAARARERLHWGLSSIIVRPWGSLPTPVTVAPPARLWRSITHTVPLGGALGARRGPPETAAYRPSEVTAVPFGLPGRTMPSGSASRVTGMRATSACGSCATARRTSTIDTLFVRKLATTISRPSGVQATVNGRDWPPGSSVPTRTRASSAPRAPARARSTSMIEMVLPSKSTFALSRAVTAMSLPFGLALIPKGPVWTGTRGATSTTGTPASALCRSITDTSSVPALPEKR